MCKKRGAKLKKSLSTNLKKEKKAKEEKESNRKIIFSSSTHHQNEPRGEKLY